MRVPVALQCGHVGALVLACLEGGVVVRRRRSQHARGETGQESPSYAGYGCHCCRCGESNGVKRVEMDDGLESGVVLVLAGVFGLCLLSSMLDTASPGLPYIPTRAQGWQAS